ncbi:MAG: tetratricopeptide repeat protein [Xanthobacteraceae bacterium]
MNVRSLLFPILLPLLLFLIPSCRGGQTAAAPSAFAERAGQGSLPETPEVERLKRAVARDPDSLSPWLALGWHLYRDRRYGEAEWISIEARARAADDPDVLWLSGLAAYMMGSHAEAYDFLFRLYSHKNRPNNLRVELLYEVIGRLALRRGDLLTADLFFQKACEEAPANWQYQFWLGYIKLQRGQHSHAAAEALEKARVLNPDNPVVLRYRAAARATADYETLWAAKRADAEELYPEAANEARNAVRALTTDLGLIADAIKADQRNPHNYEQLGRVSFVLGRYREAIAALRTAIALEPRYAGSRYLLAKALLVSVGDDAAIKEAETELIESIALDPKHWESGERGPHINLLLALFIKHGRFGEALRLAEWRKAHAEPP